MIIKVPKIIKKTVTKTVFQDIIVDTVNLNFIRFLIELQSKLLGDNKKDLEALENQSVYLYVKMWIYEELFDKKLNILSKDIFYIMMKAIKVPYKYKFIEEEIGIYDVQKI